jgi:hypothetical protein
MLLNVALAELLIFYYLCRAWVSTIRVEPFTPESWTSRIDKHKLKSSK